jgi:cell division protein DivIC
MKRTKKVNRRIRIYLLTIIGLLGFLGYKMYYYWPKIFSNYQEKQKLENEYNDLLEEEEVLSSDIIKLNDPDYIARFAREKYLYSKDGEIIIRIVE